MTAAEILEQRLEQVMAQLPTGPDLKELVGEIKKTDSVLSGMLNKPAADIIEALRLADEHLVLLALFSMKDMARRAAE